MKFKNIIGAVSVAMGLSIAYSTVAFAGVDVSAGDILLADGKEKTDSPTQASYVVKGDKIAVPIEVVLTGDDSLTVLDLNLKYDNTALTFSEGSDTSGDELEFFAFTDDKNGSVELSALGPDSGADAAKVITKKAAYVYFTVNESTKIENNAITFYDETEKEAIYDGNFEKMETGITFNPNDNSLIKVNATKTVKIPFDLSKATKDANATIDDTTTITKVTISGLGSSDAASVRSNSRSEEIQLTKYTSSDEGKSGDFELVLTLASGDLTTGGSATLTYYSGDTKIATEAVNYTVE